MHRRAPGLWLRVLCGVTGLSITAATHVGGQVLETVPLGARVIVMADDQACTRRWLVGCPRGAAVGGTLQRVTADTLILQLGRAGVISLPRRNATEVLVSQGRSRVRTALRSAFLFGVVAYAIGHNTDATRRSTLQGAATLAGAGLVMGALLPQERWTRVPSP